MSAGAPPTDADRRPPMSRTAGLAVLGAVLAAAAIRAPFLADGLWYDEIAAFASYSIDGPSGAVGRYFSQANHVLNQLLAWASTSVLGIDEAAMRLPSFLAGLGAVVATAMLGREARGDRLAAASAAAIALMPTAVLPATEARGYALMMMFSALSSAFLLRGTREGGFGAWAGYAVSVALGAWSHLVFACVPAFHAAWLAVHAVRDRDAVGRRRAWAGLAAVAAAGALALAEYAPILGQMLRIRDEFRALDGNEPTLLSAEGAWMAMSAGGSWCWWASLAALPLVAAGIAAAARDAALRSALLVSLGGVAVALLFPTVLGSWLYARFLAFAVPGVALLVGAGACALWERRRAAAIAASALACTAWIASLAVLGPRQQLREAIDLVRASRAPGEGAFAVGLPDDVHLWYASLAGMEMPGSGPYGAGVAMHLNNPSMRWCVLLYPRALAERRAALEAAGFAAVREFPGWIDHGDGAVVVLRRR